MVTEGDLGIVVIGRNEGPRLIECLGSLGSHIFSTIYVDSGSEDGSMNAAYQRGAQAILLDRRLPFTAARARNAGFEALVRKHPDVKWVQFIDGDCEISANWLDRGVAFLTDNSHVGVVCGRRRERHPDRTIYNWMCDVEWDTPCGAVQACGGDAMMRREAFERAGGYRDNVIAGEEPELCIRLRQNGWSIWRLDADMTLHDANIEYFRQWWKRTMRAGHAYAEVSWMYRGSPDQIWKRHTLRAVLWPLPLILAVVLGFTVHPLFMAICIVYPLQVLRLAFKSAKSSVKWQLAWFSVIGKFAECVGVAKFHFDRVTSRKARLIEYK